MTQPLPDPIEPALHTVLHTLEWVKANLKMELPPDIFEAYPTLQVRMWNDFWRGAVAELRVQILAEAAPPAASYTGTTTVQYHRDATVEVPIPAGPWSMLLRNLNRRLHWRWIARAIRWDSVVRQVTLHGEQDVTLTVPLVGKVRYPDTEHRPEWLGRPVQYHELRPIDWKTIAHTPYAEDR